MTDQNLMERGKEIVASGKYRPADARTDGKTLLDDLEKWFTRYIAMPDAEDYKLLALWTVSTHLAEELYTTARLLIDSTMPGSGKTTVLEHLAHLCWWPVQAASISSPALLVRLLQGGVRTLLIDEVDRSLNPKKPGVEDLIGIINSGYKRGATRPVLVPAKGGNWEVREMPTFCPVAMAGNSPHLPDDTKSRSIRILLMPDLDGTIEDSDWEHIEGEAEALRDRIIGFAEQHRVTVAHDVDLPAGCVGRAKEKWRPLKRVAVAAGGHWPAIADQLIRRGLAEDHHERDAGLRALPPGMILMTDLRDVWPDTDELVPTKELVARLVAHNPDYWGDISSYGKALTEQRFGRIVTQSSKVTSQRPGGRGPRGYMKAQFTGVWHRLGIGRDATGASGEAGASGADDEGDTPADNQMHRSNQMHRIKSEAPKAGAQAGASQAQMWREKELNIDRAAASKRAATPLDNRRQELGARRTIRVRGKEVPRCYICGKAVMAGQGEAHLACLNKQETAS